MVSRSTLPRAALLLALLAPAASLPAAMPAEAQQVTANRIVAVVNGDAISRADVDSRRRLFALTAGLPVSGTSADGQDRLNDQILRLLVDERLRMQEVARRRIPVTDADIAGAIREIESRNGLAAGSLQNDLRRAGVEPRVLFDQIRVQIGWTRLLRQLLGPQAEPTEADVRDFIANARARVGEPEYLVSEIFIPVDDPRQEAETRRFVDDVIGRLRNGVPFPVAATQFSQAQTALQGGDLGWVRAEQLDPEVARIAAAMPVGAVSNPIRVPGGWQIVTLRQKRESGRDMATMLSIRQAFFPFSTTLDPNNPTAQQRQQVERAVALQNARGCEAVEAANRGGPRPADPGQIRLDSVQPAALRELLAGLQTGRPSQPIISPDGVAVIAVCSRETRNLAEITPEQARATLLRDRLELLSRQQQRDLRRRAQIDIRDQQPQQSQQQRQRQG